MFLRLHPHHHHKQFVVFLMVYGYKILQMRSLISHLPTTSILISLIVQTDPKKMDGLWRMEQWLTITAPLHFGTFDQTRHLANTGTSRRPKFVHNCSYVQASDSMWHRQNVSPNPQPSTITIPSATFSKLSIPAKGNVSISMFVSIASNATAAEEIEDKYASSSTNFAKTWNFAQSGWDERWSQVFTPQNTFFSGSLPTLDLGLSGSKGQQVMNVFYMSVLSVVSNLRTNLPLVYSKVFVNGQGNLGGFSFGDGRKGIGGSRSWWWDEGLTSLMISLLEPEGRAATMNAWWDHDYGLNETIGHGLGNGYAMDCEPIGTGSCNYPANKKEKRKEPKTRRDAAKTPEYGFYCYNPWAYYMAMSNHVRVNNASDVKMNHNGGNIMTALLNISTDWENYLIPGTNLVDYGPAMDGFSPTYKHVMPGCGQGNNIFMLRDLATYNSQNKEQLLAKAKGLVDDTISKMYSSSNGHGWFNVIFPGKDNKTLDVYEMRHVVDFFSVTFGMCGTRQPCDMAPKMREELGAWFREESVTSTWIRATSPRCNCSNTWTIPISGSEGGTKTINLKQNDSEWPAYSTCKAGRPDHGSNGAYPSWPAFSCEALCYVDGNCSSAFDIMASFADNTKEGPFGQATEVPQLPDAPYTPFNSAKGFKPVAGVTRYIAIEGGSFHDAIVRGFFGYHPTLQTWPSGKDLNFLNSTLLNPNTDPGFKGTLSNLRTPFGLATITASESGLTISLQD
eukprot:m.72778 g.72778  ORF g.72778 m.72778 type:complete len:733 (-) comp12357_c0_seq3:125-2323(-)